ncbi:MAG: ribulokinase [Ruminococcaceae bacterium]|nr:ribulokinase [Oscillospiraceae bacterium]
MKKYTVGLDFGTGSMRALLVDLASGKELGYKECKYPHGVMESTLPDGTRLGPEWSLQHPEDYLFALTETVPNLLREHGVLREEVVGLGIDFTSSTVIPLDATLTPLCLMKEYSGNPHAYAKLWKHHSAQYCAELITDLAKKTEQAWLVRNGGRISPELAFPKLLQVALEAPELFDRVEYFMDAGDYMVSLLTGEVSRSTCIAGYKYCWSKEEGFPDEGFLNGLAPDFGSKVLKKLRGKFFAPGASAGTLTKEFAEKLGLSEKTAVSAAVIDAHAAIPAIGQIGENQMLMILGTSGCHHLLSKSYRQVEGVFGIVEDGVIEGFYCYEAGQSGMGDHFEWLLRNCVGKDVEDRACAKGMSVLNYLAQLASEKRAGETGLLCLDWFNGNRSVLNDCDLSGVILGLTLSTQPQDLYRALVEAVAFGTRKIIESFENSGVAVDALFATGTMSKSSFVMQTFADVTGKRIRIVASQNGPALGAAIFAASASGTFSLAEATKRLGKLQENSYDPDPKNSALYDKLYGEYCLLHDYFGREENPVLKTLKSLRK